MPEEKWQNSGGSWGPTVQTESVGDTLYLIQQQRILPSLTFPLPSNVGIAQRYLLCLFNLFGAQP